MKEYILLEGDHASISRKINEHLTKGFELYGNPYALNNAHFQAMVKGGASQPTPPEAKQVSKTQNTK